MGRAFLISIFFLFSALSTGVAGAQDFAVGARVGTLGPGLEASARITPHLNVRVGGSYFSYSREDLISDLEIAVYADSEIRLRSASVLLDVMPFRAIFRMTAGVIWNDNSVSALLTPAESYTVEGKTFSPERIGTMTTVASHRIPFQPYLGLGLGNPVLGSATLLLDFGALYTSSPRIFMNGDGMIAPTAQQAGDLEIAFETFRWYPVAAVGISFRL